MPASIPPSPPSSRKPLRGASLSGAPGTRQSDGTDVLQVLVFHKLLTADQMKKWKDIKKRVASAATGPETAPTPPTKVGDDATGEQ